MYITKIEIANIRAIKELCIEFPKPAGWHVLLGDNGAGKSSLIRAICVALIGPSEVLRLDPDFSTWVTNGQSQAQINLWLNRDSEVDKRSGQGGAKAGVRNIEEKEIVCKTVIEQEGQEEGKLGAWKFKEAPAKKNGSHPDNYNWGSGSGWFSAAFGPYRRFTGGDQALENFYLRNPKIGAHLTAFKENAALTESVIWLKDLLLKSLSRPSSEETTILKGIVHFTNQEDLLPNGFELTKITPDGPLFRIPNGSSVHLYELSEGIKSVTSLAFELMRLLLRVYSAQDVFKNFLDDNKADDKVEVPGVVLIDEIDVHLHPLWQARIGKWFTRCFPNIQFIVTTHSPLICRAAAQNGSIWRLDSTDDGDVAVKAITGSELDNLLYGDILDAYGTGVFGTGITRDANGQKKLERLARLNLLHYRGEIKPEEQLERELLLNIFPTNDVLFS